MIACVPVRLARVTRLLPAAFMIVVLGLMTAGHPAGQGVAGSAVDFAGGAAPNNHYITFGAATGANGLNATNFTVELWFKREGTGQTTTTGTGGITSVVPLVAKGRGEAENSNIDTNYFLGINTATNSLAADFEEGAGQTTPGLNHPVTAGSAIALNTWYHAAATYNSTTGVFNLYLNGVLDGTITVPAGARLPRADSIQHASIGSALTSTGVAAGFFNGVIDEVRIWNVARTQSDIAATMYQEVTSGAGLIGRWGLNEGAGTNAVNSVAGRPNGTLTNGPTWAGGFPLPDTTEPAVPQNVVAEIGNGLVTIAWDKNTESDLAGYNVYKNGAATPLNAAPLPKPIFTDSAVNNGTSYTYTVTAVDQASNESSASAAVLVTPNAFAGAAMQFSGAAQYVTFGPATGLGGLGAQTFTIETWFKRTGAGAGTSTGTGGFEGTSAIPLVTKGRGESENSNVDMNYFLGIHATTGVLIADFEDNTSGGNHPVSGTTPIPISTTAWHHAAATYDGSTWSVYLDGALEGTVAVGALTPRFDSIQHAAIGTAMNSTGTAAGFFDGLLDEVRIWDYARTQLDIQTSMNQPIASASGLIGRWALDEASGSIVAGTARAINGTAIGTPQWTAGYPFALYATEPSEPQNLTATPGNARVTLNWTPNTEADLAGYNVYRGTTSPVSIAGPPLNGSTPVASASYSDIGLTNGTQYFYVVTAVDGFGNQSGASNEATATPLASLNLPPSVTAGPDRVIVFSGSAALTGSASDDGPFSVQWTSVGGPGVVNFVNAAAASTTATFTAPGTYVLRLTANDGTLSAFDEMTVTVDAVLVGAGDIAPDCVTNPGVSMVAAQGTATLLDGIPGTVFTLGDNAYQDGTAAQFANCYDPAWGRHKARTRPVTGNHDYNSANATPYFDYFNGAGNQTGPAGDRAGGYYSYNLGNWHVVVLNSECTSLWNTNGCAAGSAQEQWLRADLAASPTNNIIAMWHRPLYSSGGAASAHAYVQPLWQALYDYGVDVWIGGHWHNYERLAPMNATGAADPTFGIRSFVIGTGGIPFASFGTILPTSEVRSNTTNGVVKFTLHESSYDWQFIPIAGQTFTDSGTGTVHGAPSGNLPPIVNAGPDVAAPSGSALLDGTVTDDGLVSPLTMTWSKSSGPGTVTFGNPDSPSTSAAFSTPGAYVVQLTVSDGQFVRSDTVTVNVTTASGNLPPSVDAGPNQAITLPALASLSGTVNDDGLPGLDVTTTWSKQSGPGTVNFDDATAAATSAAFSTAGTYVLRLTASDSELTVFDELTVTVNPVEVNTAIDFGGSNAYVTFGAAPGLGLSTMTIEAWFRRDGAGIATSTGSGGVTAIPLVTKGMAQSDGSNVDMNYFLGIRSSDGVLTADFEDAATGLNHPVAGTTPILANGIWHHAAATYNGSKWFLYLDGALEAELSVGAFTPRSDSIQHAAIGSALQSTGVPSGQTQGFFDGVIDEVRLWDRALTPAEVQANINTPITGAPNLVARWGFNEGTGTAVNDTTSSPIGGTMIGTAYSWVAGAPFNLEINQAPGSPVLVAPADGATGVGTSPSLTVGTSDPDNDPLTVTFYGRAVGAAPAPDFTLVALPDTQHYSDDATRAATFTAQTQWIVNNRNTLNIPFVTHLGDIVEHIDSVPAEWVRADASIDVLDGQVPYGLAPGNHDMNSAGVATNYDLFFPVSRMSGYPWYGGYLGQNLFSFTDPINRENKNNFELFSAGGMDFVIIHLEYDMPGYAVAWANRVLAAYPNRRAIISTHLFLNASGSRPTTVLNRTTDGTPASTVWTNLVFPNCNVFLVLNGHYPGEANRTDQNACGQPVHQLASDYQSRVNGGDGWLRYMTFKPSENKIYVYTYSPTLNAGLGQFETDANSQFVLDYNMQGVPFAPIATNTNVTSGSPTTTPWPGRASNTQYEWYASVSDGIQTVNGPIWTFTTIAPPVDLPPTADAQDVTTAEDTAAGITLTGSDPEGTALAFAVVTGPAHGALSGTAPDLTYTPSANYFGPDSFTFTVTDVGGKTSAAATVSMTVTAVNDLPTANAQSVTTPEDTARSITLTGSDPEGTALTFAIVTGPAHGALSGTAPNVTYTPAANYFGPDSFTFTVTDGGSATSAPATVSISVTAVNDVPTANAQSVTTAEDTPVGITLSGTDVEGAALTFNIVTAPAHGTLSGTGAARIYTPTANYSGPDSFTFTVNDGSATSVAATVSITVTPVSDPPVANNQSVTTVQGTPVGIVLTGSDPDGGPLTFTVQSGPSNGTLSGTAPDLIYTPAPLFAGSDGFTFVTNDGSTDSAPATVSVNVNPAVAFTPLGVGTHFPTVDNADQGAGPGPRAITPPSVQAGDLVVIVAAYRGTATLTLGETGGQTWTAEPNAQANSQTVRVFWAQFNGTWTANPSVTNSTGTATLSVYSFGVDMAPGTYPQLDVPFVSASHAGGTVSVPSFTTSTPGAFALAGWISGDNNTWSAPPAGWSATGGQAQWRNSNGSDNSIALAYRVMTAAGATGAIARNQSANGPDNGLYFRLAFKAVTVTPPTIPAAPANLQAAASVGQVALTWADNATNEFGFQIERCTTAGCANFAPLAGVGPNVTSYSDTSAGAGTTYRYRVRAHNVFGPSDYSTSADVTTPTPAFSFRGVGAHFPTVENADQGGGPGPRAITPAAVQPGDLVVVVAAYRGTATLSLSETGGQVWTAEANTQANGQTVRVFWTQFNGVWTANPAVTNTTGTASLAVYSFAFDVAPGLYPDIDVPFASGAHTGGTVTVPSFTTNTAGVMAIAGWISSDNNTWSAPTAGWSAPGGQAQWRNSAGSDNSIALAYRLIGPAGGTGTIVRTQSGGGPDNGIYFRLAFRALEIPTAIPDRPTDVQATAAVGQVALSWTDNGTNEAGFNIERCAGAGCTSFAPLATVGPNTTSYIDGAVAGSTVYRYRVRSYNLFSPSDYSNIADAETPAPPPAPPIPFTFRSVGTHFPTADNTVGQGPGPRAVTPPASMQAGDLYVIVAAYRGNVTLSLADTGGQAWTAEPNAQANNVTVRVFWSRFNGTWTGTPSVTNAAGTEALSVYSFAVATTPGMHPEIDVPFLSGSHAGGSVSVPGGTTNTAGALVLAGWLSDENNSWTAPTAGWSVPGGQQQWRNTQGEDTSLAFAYRVLATAGPTGAVVRSQTSGSDSGVYFRIAWKQVPD